MEPIRKRYGAKLNNTQVREIRRNYPKFSSTVLAEKYGVSPSTIMAAVRKRRYREVKDYDEEKAVFGEQDTVVHNAYYYLEKRYLHMSVGDIKITFDLYKTEIKGCEFNTILQGERIPTEKATRVLLDSGFMKR